MSVDTSVSTRQSVLVVDDDPATLTLLQEIFDDQPVVLHTASSFTAGLEQVRLRRPNVVILDLIMPGVTGMEMLDRILHMDSTIEVILLTGHYSTEAAVQAIQRGAADYLVKPISPERLVERVLSSLSIAEERHRSVEIDETLVHNSRFEGIVGRSPVMLELFSKMRRIAPHYQTALVTGATGTGKELAARALHNLSPVAGKPYVVCNCAAIVETLFESEIFGHVKGAFTGALHDKAGMVEHANGGTLFLDEIGEMPPISQAKLLRLIQNREVQRLGAPAPKAVDVRIIAATHQPLADMVIEKRFRADLFYRLSAIEIHVPTLVERREDIPILQRHFLNVYSSRYGKSGLRMSPRALATLTAYDWPGNVRELENAISHACMMADLPTIEPRHFPEALSNPPRPEVSRPMSLKAMQKQHVERILTMTGGNVAQAAKLLGVGRATLYRMR
ncbi:MAG TPA: sigma-54 dependent transcriptional regulator [Bryobacteraceae bacterium]|nr:sigma-54 dependent transcriptional regulator [Bryobacteraceae bacterium]